jgi:hypothetical protein
MDSTQWEAILARKALTGSTVSFTAMPHGQDLKGLAGIIKTDTEIANP